MLLARAAVVARVRCVRARVASAHSPVRVAAVGAASAFPVPAARGPEPAGPPAGAYRPRPVATGRRRPARGGKGTRPPNRRAAGRRRRSPGCTGTPRSSRWWRAAGGALVGAGAVEEAALLGGQVPSE
ncbi:hypothetical protein Shyhy01_31220 [Streptomyces hygroscopicus subsp. hygroscopicus]|nr:hypothetical protein Shyhy01_31220 [Streptomyces hygroscopicus subsp. hygroscopicus]